MFPSPNRTPPTIPGRERSRNPRSLPAVAFARSPPHRAGTGDSPGHSRLDVRSKKISGGTVLNTDGTLAYFWGEGVVEERAMNRKKDHSRPGDFTRQMGGER